MSIPPESIRTGKCYLTTNGQVARVLKLEADGVYYEFRSGVLAMPSMWTRAITTCQSFNHRAEREVPCDWTPSSDNQTQEVKG
jgi:hypothetical protein